MKFHRLMMLLAFYDMVYIVLSLLLFTVPQVRKKYMGFPPKIISGL